MTPKAARQKGRRFEKEVAVRLSEWFFGVSDGLQPTRGSRSLAGFEEQRGDLGVSRSNLGRPWVFSVECKHRDSVSGTWSLDDLVIRGKKSALFSFWTQCRHEALRNKGIPLLICKRNYRPNIVLLQKADFVGACGPKSLERLIIIYEVLVATTLDYLLCTLPDDWVRYWYYQAQMR